MPAFSVHGHPVAVDAMKFEFMFVSFLFIGTLFNFLFHRKISWKSFAFGVGVIMTMFFVVWRKTSLVDQFWQIPANYLYALIVFSVCYGLRHKFTPSRVFDFFADISYPLYLVHSIIGYATMRISMAHGVPYLAAAALGLGIAIGIAYFLHVVVEMPTAHLGKYFTKPAPRTVSAQAP